MNRYIHQVTRDGRTYNYFRPGGRLKRHQFPTVRLSDDLETAEQQAALLAELKPDAPAGALHDSLAAAINETRRRAKRRGLSFTVTEPQLKALLEAQDRRCAVSGLPFDLEHRGDWGEAFRRPFAPSLDRRNPRFGYTPENVRIVCCAVNVALNEWGLETFLKVARAVAEKNVSATPLENDTAE